MEVKQLWLQQAVAEGRFKLQKVDGVHNPADILTKYRALPDYQQLLAKVCVEVVGRLRQRDGGAGENRDPSGVGGLYPRVAEENGDPSDIGWIRLGSGRCWADAAEEQEQEQVGSLTVRRSGVPPSGPRQKSA